MRQIEALPIRQVNEWFDYYKWQEEKREEDRKKAKADAAANRGRKR